MIKHQKVAVIDYGMGNLWSVLSALNYLGVNPSLSSDPTEILNADTLVLPGVGSFRIAMESLKKNQLDIAIKEAVTVKQRKILGICLGFQMLAETGTEDGISDGLGLIPGKVERFSSEELKSRKLPHIGFNHVKFPDMSGLFAGFGASEDFYFVHSYRLLPISMLGEKAICNYGVDFLAAYQHENVFGAQFHPEKSQTNGLRMLSNFLNI
jgi:glutamine amidotransferase